MASEQAQRIDILLPPPMRGSGGHRTAVQAGEALARSGYVVHIHFQRPAGQARAGDDSVTEQAKAWHGVERCTVEVEWPEDLPNAAAIIATTWQSAAYSTTIATRAQRMHFVQDYEAWFHPMGDEYLAAKGVHELGLKSVVIGYWLQAKLWQDHRLPTWSVPFTADLSLYRPAAAERSPVPTIVAMYQPDKPRRCGALMHAALATALERHREVRVVTVGSERSPDLGPRHTHLGLLPKEELPGLYATAWVGLSISSSNPSRVPFEMMAAGLPVVELGVPNTIYDLPDTACLLAQPDPESLSTALLRVLEDDRVRQRLADGAIRIMADRDAAVEGKAFVDAVEQALAGAAPGRGEPSPQYRADVCRAPAARAWAGVSGPAIKPEWMGLLEEQVAVNEQLSRENQVLHEANGNLHEANRSLNDVNRDLNEVNRDLNEVNAALNEVNHALANENQQLSNEVEDWKRRYSSTLRGRMQKRRQGREPKP